MHTAFTKTNLLALLGAAVLVPATAAGASTGGVSPPQAGAARPAAPALPAPRHGAIATWFGPGFYGQRTACGQVLTPSVVGVANRTLPCGTLVSVSYKHRHVVVPVLDRGPFTNGADWDLTSEAARALGIADTVRVRTKIVGSTPNVPTLGLPPAARAFAATGGAAAAP